MMPWVVCILFATVVLLVVGGLAFRQLRRRGLDRWLPTYVRESDKRVLPARGKPEQVHVLLCIADHFEPRLGGVPSNVARERVERWVRDYPRVLGGIRDSDGRPPRHSFFYPIEEYDPEYLDALAGLCAAGFGEVEVHLHHDHDTADNLRATLQAFKALLAERHGLLARRKDTGELVYGFIHGNWALDNSRPDGRWCGVNNELDVLRETGCYADFTLPSAPSPTQTRKINSIYYAVDDPRRPKSHDWGIDVGKGARSRNALLMIQGPLLLNWNQRKFGFLPSVENACLQGNQPPSLQRLDLWLKARVQIPSRPDWFFVKLHTHGANENNHPVLLGEPMIRFHDALARRAREDSSFHYHYVTAREMANLVHAAEAGWTGSVAEARDFEIVSNISLRELVVQRPGKPNSSLGPENQFTLLQ
jgi:hypothetical protein